MKQLMMIALMMCFTSLSFGQNSEWIPNDSDPVRRSDINEINLKLDKIEKFGKQHRTGNHLILAGTLFNVFGLVIMNSQLYSYTLVTGDGSGQSNQKLANGALVVGSLLTTTGLVINLDSFRHLRND